MNFSSARYQFTKAGMSELAAGDVVQRAYDTRQPQTLAGITVTYRENHGFTVYR